MSKNSKCINIFEKNKKDLNLYQISIIVILFITLLQVGINLFKNTQLNEYISDYEWQKDIQTEQINNNIPSKNSSTKQSKINLSKLKEVSSIIGMEKIQSIYSDSNKIQIQGYCEDTEVLQRISDLENISNFNIQSLQKKDEKYFFKIEYTIGGRN
ncbi:hypothetical protein [Intestinibacter sp.]|uniref:hypothetical protein n=1 Tax=Intestinibacter sp. TaxID=1965304 RepID=UPI002A916892|nr:hypothetical protein [Intestinibacter sp.]MDY5211929.1 hypothetical protein [Intestinibacter sp.]